jgi:hypothetical protein
MNTLRSLGVAKPKIGDAAKLASARIKGDPRYEQMRQDAVNGKSIKNIYKTNATKKRLATLASKKAPTAVSKRVKKGKNANTGAVPTSFMDPNSTGIETQTNAAPSFRPFSTQTNRSKYRTFETQTNAVNIANTNATNSTVDAAMTLTTSLKSLVMKEVGEIQRLLKTLKRKAPKGRGTRTASRLASLPSPPAFANNAGLTTVLEENNDNNSFTPPP